MLLIVRIIKPSNLTVIEFLTPVSSIEMKPFNSFTLEKLSLTCSVVNDNFTSKVTFELKNLALTFGW